MNGSYNYGNGNPIQDIPLPDPRLPFPPPDVAGIPFSLYSLPMPPQQTMAPVNIPPGEQVNNGHHSFSYTPLAHLLEVNHGQVPYPTFVPQYNVPNYGEEDMLPRLTSEIYSYYQVNANSYGYGQLSDPVWVPMPGEIRAMGGPVSAPGTPEIPTVGDNGWPTAPLPSRLPVSADDGQSKANARRATRRRRKRSRVSRLKTLKGN